MTTMHIPNCWICGRAVSLGNSKIDENHLAVHESCYVAKMAGFGKFPWPSSAV
jgi:hypothetical protein